MWMLRRDGEGAAVEWRPADTQVVLDSLRTSLR
jgi:hypothetical protein